MRAAGTERLRVLVAGPCDGGRLASHMAALGHDVVAGDIASADAGSVPAHAWPDVALVELEGGSQLALELMERLAGTGAFPVVAVIDAADPAGSRAAAELGAFACVSAFDPGSWQAAIETAMRRFADYRQLADAFERRAVIERAKGILMERHAVTERGAFEVMRRHARDDNRRLVDVAAHVVEGHALLPPAGTLVAWPPGTR